MKYHSIFFITENYVSGGANKYAEDVVTAMSGDFKDIFILGNTEAIKTFNHSRIPSRASYHTISIFNASEKVKNFTRMKRAILKLLLFPVSFIKNFLSYLSLYFFILAKKPHHVILCNGGYPASNYLIFSLLFIPKKYKPVMTIVSTPTLPKNSLTTICWKIINRMVQNRTHMIIVNSTAIKNDMVNKLNFSPDNINIVRNGVDDLVIKKNLHSDKIVIGFVSRVEKSKGVCELLEAYNKLCLKHDNLELLIVGNGSLDLFVKEASDKNPTIKVLGHISGDLSKIFEDIDIFTLPSYQEGLPYSVIEACMAECTVVATNVGGIPEIITNQISGVLVPPQNSEELFKAFLLVIENPELRKKMAHLARKSYEDHFTYIKMRDQVQVILR